MTDFNFSVQVTVARDTIQEQSTALRLTVLSYRKRNAERNLVLRDIVKTPSLVVDTGLKDLGHM